MRFNVTVITDPITSLTFTPV